MKKLIYMLIVTLAGSVQATPGYQMNSYATVKGSQTQAVFAWCDSPTRVLALGKGSKTQLFYWAKTRTGLGAMSTSAVSVGQADPGAGQIYYPLQITAGSRNGQSGFLHSSNIENVQDPAYRMTHVNEFKLGSSIFTCRYVPQAAFMGVTGKRTVIVWDAGDVITYATRNFDGSAGVQISNGLKRHTTEGGTSYLFKTSDGFTYEVLIDEYRPSSGAKLRVFKGKTLKASELFWAYSVSQPKK